MWPLTRKQNLQKIPVLRNRVLVSGSMKNNNYTNKAGEKVYGVELQANHIDFAEGKRERRICQKMFRHLPHRMRRHQEKREEQLLRQRHLPQGTMRERVLQPERPRRTSRGLLQVGQRQGRSSAGRTSSTRRTGNRFSNMPESVEDANNPFN